MLQDGRARGRTRPASARARPPGARAGAPPISRSRARISRAAPLQTGSGRGPPPPPPAGRRVTTVPPPRLSSISSRPPSCGHAAAASGRPPPTPRIRSRVVVVGGGVAGLEGPSPVGDARAVVAHAHRVAPPSSTVTTASRKPACTRFSTTSRTAGAGTGEHSATASQTRLDERRRVRGRQLLHRRRECRCRPRRHARPRGLREAWRGGCRRRCEGEGRGHLGRGGAALYPGRRAPRHPSAGAVENKPPTERRKRLAAIDTSKFADRENPVATAIRGFSTGLSTSVE